MKLSISQKLNTAFIGLTLILLMATLALARWSFNQGFLNYVNGLEQIRLQQAQLSLAEEYSNAGNSWSSLTDQQLGRVLKKFSPGVRHPMPPPRSGGPPRGGGRPAGGRSAQAGPPTALYDSEGVFVAGVESTVQGRTVLRFPIVVDSQTVGELRSEPRIKIDTPSETAFLKQQLSTSWLIGLGGLILAVAISLFLSRHFLAPIKKMITGVGLLSAGDYSMRVAQGGSDELAQLGRDINRLGAKLEKARSMRQKVLADISHELRTPLAILSAEIEGLKDGLRNFDEEQLESLDQEVNRLRYLIDDLYEFSVSEIGGLRYQFSEVALDDLLLSAIGSVERSALDAGVELIADELEEVVVQGDGNRLHQLFANLFANSLAYTDSPGRLIVTLRSLPNAALIVIEDSSPGVPPENCEELFEPLFRMEGSRSRRTGGAGLGLALCRNIVERHGGSITIAPSNLGGLKVEIELPVTVENQHE